MRDYLLRLALFGPVLETLKEVLLLNKKYFSYEELSSRTKVKGIQLGSHLASLGRGDSAFIHAFARKSMKVDRIRKGKKKNISLSVQIYEVDRIVFENREEILKHVNFKIKTLELL